MPNLINDTTTKVLEAALDGLASRQQIVGHNIANAETPGYQALAVTFDRQLREAMGQESKFKMAQTHTGHLASPATREQGPNVTPRQTSSMRLDGNNVDIDLEMSQLAETSIQYQSLTQLVSRKLALLKAIAMGR